MRAVFRVLRPWNKRSLRRQMCCGAVCLFGNLLPLSVLGRFMRCFTSFRAGRQLHECWGGKYVCFSAVVLSLSSESVTASLGSQSQGIERQICLLKSNKPSRLWEVMNKQEWLLCLHLEVTASVKRYRPFCSENSEFQLFWLLFVLV